MKKMILSSTVILLTSFSAQAYQYTPHCYSAATTKAENWVKDKPGVKSVMRMGDPLDGAGDDIEVLVQATMSDGKTKEYNVAIGVENDSNGSCRVTGEEPSLAMNFPSTVPHFIAVRATEDASSQICGSLNFTCGDAEDGKEFCEYTVTSDGHKYDVVESAKRKVSNKEQGASVCLNSTSLTSETASNNLYIPASFSHFIAVKSTEDPDSEICGSLYFDCGTAEDGDESCVYTVTSNGVPYDVNESAKRQVSKKPQNARVCLKSSSLTRQTASNNLYVPASLNAATLWSPANVVGNGSGRAISPVGSSSFVSGGTGAGNI